MRHPVTHRNKLARSQAKLLLAGCDMLVYRGGLIGSNPATTKARPASFGACDPGCDPKPLSGHKKARNLNDSGLVEQGGFTSGRREDPKTLFPGCDARKPGAATTAVKWRGRR